MVLIINDEEKNKIEEKSKDVKEPSIKDRLNNLLKIMYEIDKHIQRREHTHSLKKTRKVENELEKIINELG